MNMTHFSGTSCCECGASLGLWITLKPESIWKENRLINSLSHSHSLCSPCIQPWVKHLIIWHFQLKPTSACHLMNHTAEVCTKILIPKCPCPRTPECRRSHQVYCQWRFTFHFTFSHLSHTSFSVHMCWSSIIRYNTITRYSTIRHGIIY